MRQRLTESLRWVVAGLLVLLLPPFAADAFSEQQCPSGGRNYKHLVVLVHGYMGSDREQEYLGETLLKESRKLSIGNGDESCSPSGGGGSRHELVILKSKANVKVSTDGIASGGKRLAAEISEWIEKQTNDLDLGDTVVTFSLIGNSLGGLYGRYALSELDFFFHDDKKNPTILPLIFCTTSSPHIGISQETFIQLPRWTEPAVATAFQQKTMDDLFGVNNSTVVKDMCSPNPTTTKARNDDEKNNYLYPLQQFRKRIAVANAYKTDFLVSVSSGAFLSLESDSIHHHQDYVTASTRWMKDMGHVVLQVVTKPMGTGSIESRDDNESKAIPKNCVDSLDRLGWHKIFIDTRKILPGFMNLQTPQLEARATYTSRELKEHFESYGTLLPIAHPLNMANSRTDLYRKMTQSGQPIVNALAELLVLDMVEFSEKHNAHNDTPNS